jgi:hypothetical protein
VKNLAVRGPAGNSATAMQPERSRCERMANAHHTCALSGCQWDRLLRLWAPGARTDDETFVRSEHSRESHRRTQFRSEAGLFPTMLGDSQGARRGPNEASI